MILTIVIPVYNGEQYIERCVKSIVNQNCSGLEIILVDDGSTDNSLAICNHLSQKAPNIITIHKKNGGVSSARNLGIDLAKGEYLMFVDVDDWLLPNTLNSVISLTSDHPDVDLFVYGLERHSKTGRINQHILQNREYRQKDFLTYISHLDVLTFGTPCAKIFKTSALQMGGVRFDEKIRLFEDVCFNFTILRAITNILTSSLVVYCYDVNNQSATAKFNGEKFISDSKRYIEIVTEQLAQLNNAPDDTLLLNDIITYTKHTVCRNILYEIYNLYRQKSYSTKYEMLNHMVNYMNSVESNWHLIFPTGFPRIIASLYNISPRLAHLLLLSIFGATNLIHNTKK